MEDRIEIIITINLVISYLVNLKIRQKVKNHVMQFVRNMKYDIDE